MNREGVVAHLGYMTWSWSWTILLRCLRNEGRPVENKWGDLQAGTITANHVFWAHNIPVFVVSDPSGWESDKWVNGECMRVQRDVTGMVTHASRTRKQDRIETWATPLKRCTWYTTRNSLDLCLHKTTQNHHYNNLFLQRSKCFSLWVRVRAVVCDQRVWNKHNSTARLQQSCSTTR
jgi:hypothetical protein